MSVSIMQIDKHKPILVIGDLGVGANVVKNLLFLDTTYTFTKDTIDDRLQYLLDTTYATELDLTTWLQYEYKTRRHEHEFGVDISDTIDVDKCMNKDLSNLIFINHSAFYEQDSLDDIKHLFNVVFVFPQTTTGLAWQVRAYTEKKGAYTLHNFTFADNIEEQKASMIAEHGIVYWIKSNVQNMYHVFRERRANFYCYAKRNKFHLLPMESLLSDNHSKAYTILSQLTNIPRAEFDTILNRWQHYHWKYEDTLNYKWFD